MRRRSFLASIAAATVLGPRGLGVAKEQPSIGWLSFEFRHDSAPFLAALSRGLIEEGLIPGRDLRLVERYADERFDTLAQLAEELINEGVGLIVVTGAGTTRVVKAVDKVPVVYGFSGDPIRAGLAQTMARPGGNSTGISFMAIELNSKRVGLLKDAIPGLHRPALLSNPNHAGEDREIALWQEELGRLGLDLRYYLARNRDELERALTSAASDEVDAIMALPSALIMGNRDRIIGAATSRRIPAISGLAPFARSGGLFSYGPIMDDVYHRLASYVVRVLRGAKPADLPIEQPTRFELVLNQKTAKALGVVFPAAMLAAADEVIE